MSSIETAIVPPPDTWTLAREGDGVRLAQWHAQTRNVSVRDADNGRKLLQVQGDGVLWHIVLDDAMRHALINALWVPDDDGMEG
jgi:hypothetical protein